LEEITIYIICFENSGEAQSLEFSEPVLPPICESVFSWDEHELEEGVEQH
jgi:hypothetical protein